MLHLNIGNGKSHVSFGLEIAYWNIHHLPYGFDLGVDFEKSTFRVYSEAQTGLYLAGIAAGPYMEIKRANPVKAGLQTSLWANAFIGVDLRARFTKGKDTFSPGLYGKYLWIPGTNLNDGFDEHHGHNWDWD
jgi:hypothetical protein